MDERDYSAMNKDIQKNSEHDSSFLDWNTLSLDQMVEYLREKYMFSSSADAKCIYHLIEFYDNNKNNNTPIEKRHIAIIARDTDDFSQLVDDIHRHKKFTKDNNIYHCITKPTDLCSLKIDDIVETWNAIANPKYEEIKSYLKNNK